MLDQKLIRENPTSVEENLSLRGKVYKISHIHELTIKKKDIDIEISSLQSESKKLSKSIGQVIGKSQNNNSQELNDLKKKGNEYRIKISELEEKQRILDKQVNDEIYNLPNFPSKDAPIGKDERDNVQIKTWGDPLIKENQKSSILSILLDKFSKLLSLNQSGSSINFFTLAKTSGRTFAVDSSTCVLMSVNWID